MELPIITVLISCSSSGLLKGKINSGLKLLNRSREFICLRISEFLESECSVNLVIRHLSVLPI